MTELDPDAPLRTGKQLHSLDQADEARLVRVLFMMVRCGMLEEGQELCCRLGQAWRAASLEGWKLFHDPNYESATDGAPGSKLPVEGNQYRDVWKRVAWTLCDDASLAQHERAVYAALCGNLAQLQPVCAGWEDLVWAGAKCSVDLMVETEVRETMVRTFEEMPPDYWNTPQSLSKVFAEIAGRGGGVAREAESPYHVIQRLVILDNYPGLVAVMGGWVAAGAQDPHLLRLMAHIVLLNRSLGVAGEPVGEEAVLRAYTELLMARERLALVPWYVAQLATPSQLPLYSSFLRHIKDREDRRLCLYLGKEVGLDMTAIVVAAVEQAREGGGGEMVESLGWLGLEEEQASHLLLQANCTVRRLLLLDDTEQGRAAAAMVPPGVLELARREWRGEGGVLPPAAVREHIALQTLFTASEAFNDWFDHFHKGRPARPELPAGASFTEKVAHEQREKAYRGELERWRGGQQVQSRQAEERIRGLLEFPGGWLLEEEEEVGEDTMEVGEVGGAVEEGRAEELNCLRRLVLPRTVLLLHSLLHSTGQYGRCLALADTVAGEALCKAYTPENLRELLGKLRESSMAGMEQGKDAWGYKKA